MSVETTFNQLPGLAKIVIVIGGTVAIGFIGFKIYSSVQEKIKHAGDYQEKEDVKADLNNLSNNNVKPSFSNSQYSGWANQIFTAFDGYQSDESVVYRVFVNMKNDADVLKLIEAYGIKEISSGTGNPQANFKGTLSGAIADELSTTEIKELNLILAKRNIKIRF